MITTTANLRGSSDTVAKAPQSLTTVKSECSEGVMRLFWCELEKFGGEGEADDFPLHNITAQRETRIYSGSSVITNDILLG